MRKMQADSLAELVRMGAKLEVPGTKQLGAGQQSKHLLG